MILTLSKGANINAFATPQQLFITGHMLEISQADSRVSKPTITYDVNWAGLTAILTTGTQGTQLIIDLSWLRGEGGHGRIERQTSVAQRRLGEVD